MIQQHAFQQNTHRTKISFTVKDIFAAMAGLVGKRLYRECFRRMRICVSEFIYRISL